MAVSMYQLSVPVFVRGLGTLDHYLDAIADFARVNALDPAKLLQARLAPDMLSFSGQVRCATDTAKNAIARLSGVEAPRLEDGDGTVDALRARLDATIAFVQSATAQLQGSESRPVAFTFDARQTTLRGDEYMLAFALPNFFFHVATGHDILRHNGVPLGKTDYLRLSA
jgi:hypothetical protein